MATLYDETETQIRRYIALLKLIPELLSLVDEKKIPFNSGVNISSLNYQEQEIVYEKIQDNPKKLTIAISSAIKNKKRSKDGAFLLEKGIELLFNPKTNCDLSRTKSRTLKLPTELLSEYFNDIELDEDMILDRIKKALDLLKMQESNAPKI